MPDHGYVARRPSWTPLLLKHAASAGAQIRQGTEVAGLADGTGRVAGVELRDGGSACADAVIAPTAPTPGSARTSPAVPSEMVTPPSRFALRCRSSGRDFDELEIHLKLRFQGDHTGWLLRVGPSHRQRAGQHRLGYVNSYRGWQKDQRHGLPGRLHGHVATGSGRPGGGTPRAGEVRAWRLPMASRPGCPGGAASCSPPVTPLGAGWPTSGAGSSGHWSPAWLPAIRRSRP